MSLEIHVYHHVDVTVASVPTTQFEALMSALSDAITALSAKVDTATARVQTDVAGLKQQIIDLQAKVDAGGATPEDFAALSALSERVDKIDPATESTLP